MQKTRFGVQDFKCHDWRVGGAAVKVLRDRHPHGELSASSEGFTQMFNMHRSRCGVIYHIHDRRGNVSKDQ